MTGTLAQCTMAPGVRPLPTAGVSSKDDRAAMRRPRAASGVNSPRPVNASGTTVSPSPTPWSPEIVPIPLSMEDQGRDATSRTGVSDEPLIDPRQLAHWLGVSEHTVRKWITRGPDAGLLPTMLRINGQVRFRPGDVRIWLDSRVMS